LEPHQRRYGGGVSVHSAGNYVQYELTDRRIHLTRSMLQAELSRLARFGIVRVHRTRLINLKCIVALKSGLSVDRFRLDSGEIAPGSRRFKSAITGIAA
jgi:DNA-binding LytR/AlgR family response regulator